MRFPFGRNKKDKDKDHKDKDRGRDKDRGNASLASHQSLRPPSVEPSGTVTPAVDDVSHGKILR